MNIKTLIVSALITTSVLTSWKNEGTTVVITPSEPAANEIWIQDNALNPIFITVSINTTITWTNKDSPAHCIASIGALFNSGELATGQSYNYKFTVPGRYFYHCPIHSNMAGEVIVQ